MSTELSAAVLVPLTALAVAAIAVASATHWRVNWPDGVRRAPQTVTVGVGEAIVIAAALTMDWFAVAPRRIAVAIAWLLVYLAATAGALVLVTLALWLRDHTPDGGFRENGARPTLVDYALAMLTMLVALGLLFALGAVSLMVFDPEPGTVAAAAVVGATSLLVLAISMAVATTGHALVRFGLAATRRRRGLARAGSASASGAAAIACANLWWSGGDSLAILFCAAQLAVVAMALLAGAVMLDPELSPGIPVRVLVLLGLALGLFYADAFVFYEGGHAQAGAAIGGGAFGAATVAISRAWRDCRRGL